MKIVIIQIQTIKSKQTNKKNRKRGWNIRYKKEEKEKKERIAQKEQNKKENKEQRTNWNSIKNELQRKNADYVSIHWLWTDLCTDWSCVVYNVVATQSTRLTSNSVRANGCPRSSVDESRTLRLSPFRSTLEIRWSLESTQYRRLLDKSAGTHSSAVTDKTTFTSW